MLAKLAVGSSNEMVRFSGTSIVVPPGLAPQVQPTGDLFALSTNVGRTPSAPLALLPEIDICAGWEIHSYVRFFVGYTLIYLTDVVRPATRSIVASTRRSFPPQRPCHSPWDRRTHRR